MEIAPHELTILASFATYPLLTVDEICRLHYHRSSVSYVNKLLSGLVHKKLLVRPARPHVSAPYYYHLTSRGVNVLTNNGIPATFTRYHYPMEREHLKATTALMMAISQLPRFQPAFTLEELYHDLALKTAGRSVRPDVLSQMSKGTTRAVLWWEVELMRKTQKQFKEKKIRRLLDFLALDYQALYGESLPTILILTPVNQHKAAMLKRWLEAELDSSYEKDKAYLFRIAYLPKEAFDPSILFFEAIWRIPFQEEYVRLFERQGSQRGVI